MQTATFVPYNDKSSARRGFVRKFPELSGFGVQQYLAQRDGKWGFLADEAGPVMVAPEEAAPVIKTAPKPRKPKAVKLPTQEEIDNSPHAGITSPEDYLPGPVTSVAEAFVTAKAIKARRDPELDAAVEEPVEAPPPAADAFSRFAFAQLGAASNKAPEAAKPLPAAKVQKDRSEANGVKHPSEGTICDQVWVICAQLSGFIAEGPHSDHSRIATLSQVVKAADAIGINKYTARTQYARWRVFNGITGRLQTL